LGPLFKQQPKVTAPLRSVQRLSTKKKQDYFWAYLFIFPTLLGTVLFNLGPVLYTVYLSFTEWGAFGNSTWGGLVNYKKILNDPVFVSSLKNTLIFTVLSVPLSIALSTVVAQLLNQQIRGVSVYRTLFFLPVVTMPAAIGIVWRWLYNADFGIINYLLNLFHIKPVGWLIDGNIALYSIIVVAIWGAIGYNMVIILAGLQNISPQFYEAASIDGAGMFTKFFQITVPLLTPTLFFVTIISMINALQTFELIFMMIGPDSLVIRDTQTLVFMFYKEAFINNDKGYGSAISLVLFLMILILTIIQFKWQKKWVHYS